MESLRVRDIMTAEVHQLTADATLDEAARFFARHHISGAPVVDQGRVVGVISKSDLVDPRIGFAAGSRRTVAAVMTNLGISVRPGDPAMKAVRLMLGEGIHRVLVLDGGALVGIVTPTDVMRALVRKEQQSEAAAAVVQRSV